MPRQGNELIRRRLFGVIRNFRPIDPEISQLYSFIRLRLLLLESFSFFLTRWCLIFRVVASYI